MTAEKNPAGVFRAWCEGWEGLPGNRRLPWGYDGGEGNPTRGRWALALAADARSEPPASGEPLTAAGLVELLNESGMTDDVYWAGLAALEAGGLEDAPRYDGGNEIAVLGALAGLRVLAAEAWQGADMPEPDSRRLGFWWLADEAADVFAAYWSDVHDANRYKAASEKVQQAALDLANALQESGLSDWLSVTDAGIWARAAGPERLAEIRREIQHGGGRRQVGPLIWPPDAGISLDLETYLRALAEYLEETDHHALSEQGRSGKKRSRALRPFVLQHIRNRVPYLFPESKRTAYRYNRRAALICSAILAQAIEPNAIANAIKGTTPRRYWLD